MSNDVLSHTVLQSMTRNFSVTDLVRTAETLKGSGQLSSVESLYANWISQNPTHPLLYAILFNHSVVLGDAGRLTEARECLEKAIALNADFMPLNAQKALFLGPASVAIHDDRNMLRDRVRHVLASIVF